MNLVERAKKALELIRQGREELAAIADAVKDGTVALATSDQEELNRMLEQEKRESQEAHDLTDDVLKRVAEG